MAINRQVFKFFYFFYFFFEESSQYQYKRCQLARSDSSKVLLLNSVHCRACLELYCIYIRLLIELLLTYCTFHNPYFLGKLLAASCIYLVHHSYTEPLARCSTSPYSENHLCAPALTAPYSLVSYILLFTECSVLKVQKYFISCKPHHKA